MLAAAMTVGSDVPALVAGGAQRVTGRGEHLSQVAAGTLHLVVVSTEPSSTRDTYACVDPTELGGSGRVSRLVAALAAGEPPLDGLLGSALEPAAGRASAAVAAWIRRVRSALPDVSWHLTGSGGAVFAVLPDARRAAELASRARQGGLAARACRTLASPG